MERSAMGSRQVFYQISQLCGSCVCVCVCEPTLAVIRATSCSLSASGDVRPEPVSEGRGADVSFRRGLVRQQSRPDLRYRLETRKQSANVCVCVCVLCNMHSSADAKIIRQFWGWTSCFLAASAVWFAGVSRSNKADEQTTFGCSASTLLLG